MLLEADKVAKQFGAFRALDGADLHVEDGEIVGLIGPNGAGKSTFFNCLVGDMTPDGGRVIFAGRDLTRATPEEHARLGMGRTFQLPATFEDIPHGDYVVTFSRPGCRDHVVKVSVAKGGPKAAPNSASGNDNRAAVQDS